MFFKVIKIKRAVEVVQKILMWLNNKFNPRILYEDAETICFKSSQRKTSRKAQRLNCKAAHASKYVLSYCLKMTGEFVILGSSALVRT